MGFVSFCFSLGGTRKDRRRVRAQALTIVLRSASVVVAAAAVLTVRGRPAWLGIATVIVLVALACVEVCQDREAPVLYHSGAWCGGASHGAVGLLRTEMRVPCLPQQCSTSR